MPKCTDCPVGLSLKIVFAVRALLEVLGFKLERYLAPILALLVHILEDVAEEIASKLPSEDNGDLPEDNATKSIEDVEEEVKAGDAHIDGCSFSTSSVQRQCLELISSIWIKYPGACNSGAFVQKVLTVVEPWMCELANIEANISRCCWGFSLLFCIDVLASLIISSENKYLSLLVV